MNWERILCKPNGAMSEIDIQLDGRENDMMI